MQVNQPQGSTAEATTTPLSVGDKVGYVALSGKKGGTRWIEAQLPTNVLVVV